MSGPMETPETDADNKKIYFINIKGGNCRAVGTGWFLEYIKQHIRTIVYSSDDQFMCQLG